MKKYIIAISLISLVFAFLPPQKATALTLSPPLLEFVVEPGGDLISEIKIFNDSKETISLYASSANFTSRDESGNPFFLFEEQEGLASWIEIMPGPIVLLPGERQRIPFSIKVPQEADAGGHYAGIFFGSAPPDFGEEEGGNVSVVSKLGVLLLLRVSGDITQESTIQDFQISNNQNFFTKLPITFSYRLRNAGNIHIRPQGIIEINNAIGIFEGKILANPVEGAVLPSSIRRFESMWQKSEPVNIEYQNFFQDFWAQSLAEYRNFAFGKYTASLQLVNVPESAFTNKISFWVFPWHFLVIFITLLLLAVLIIVFVISRYNRWIIRRARINFKEEANNKNA